MTIDEFGKDILKKIAGAQFVMLRYETEFTPCTGITAVTKQERRHFANGVVVAPWCPNLKRKAGDESCRIKGRFRDTGVTLGVHDAACRVLATTDEFAPIVFLEVAGHFLGRETPYDTPAEPPVDSLGTLKTDTLYFGLAVEALLRHARPVGSFVWGADWETVPALFLLRNRHHISLTLHNTFDECIAKEADAFDETFAPVWHGQGPPAAPLGQVRLPCN